MKTHEESSELGNIVEEQRLYYLWRKFVRILEQRGQLEQTKEGTTMIVLRPNPDLELWAPRLLRQSTLRFLEQCFPGKQIKHVVADCIRQIFIARKGDDPLRLSCYKGDFRAPPEDLAKIEREKGFTQPRVICETIKDGKPEPCQSSRYEELAFLVFTLEP